MADVTFHTEATQDGQVLLAIFDEDEDEMPTFLLSPESAWVISSQLAESAEKAEALDR